MRKLHLDTDISGDIDDLCALALTLNCPEGELVPVTTVSDAGGRRAGYARYVLEIAGRTDVPVAAGADISVGCYQHWQPGFHPGPLIAKVLISRVTGYVCGYRVNQNLAAHWQFRPVCCRFSWESGAQFVGAATPL